MLSGFGGLPLVNMFTYIFPKRSVLLQFGMTGEGFSLTPEDFDKEHLLQFLKKKSIHQNGH